MKRITLMFFILCFFLIPACSPHPTPAATPTQPPTPTATPKPFTGKLFFDMNGSGLQDESSFIYDPERLADPRQPLQPDLDKAIKDYVATYPNLKKGDLVTLPEPGLSGYKVCIEQECATTSADGSFSITNKAGSSTAILLITDPYADKPALAMRYINEWKGAVVVPAYTQEIDTATINKLTIIPDCKINNMALVCKQDADKLMVRDQHLNDSILILIKDGIHINLGKEYSIGLMQGFLTQPFMKEQVSDPYIFDFFDIIGYRIFDFAGKNTFLNTQDGKMLSYDGKYKGKFSPTTFNGKKPSPGAFDSHTGQDYLIPLCTFIVSGAPTSKVWYLQIQDELRVDINFNNPNNPNNIYSTDYGHLYVQLVTMNQTVYRGQIVGLSGNTGSGSGGFPQLHYNFQERVQEGWKYIDMYRTIITLDPLPKNYWGSTVSYWTNDNLPQFPLSG